MIVTHNMQQAARVSDQTAFLLAGDLVEFSGPIAFSPRREIREPRTTSPASSVEGWRVTRGHTDREYEGQLEELRERLLRMAGASSR